MCCRQNWREPLRLHFSLHLMLLMLLRESLPVLPMLPMLLHLLRYRRAAPRPPWQGLDAGHLPLLRFGSGRLPLMLGGSRELPLLLGKSGYPCRWLWLVTLLSLLRHRRAAPRPLRRGLGAEYLPLLRFGSGPLPMLLGGSWGLLLPLWRVVWIDLPNSILLW